MQAPMQMSDPHLFRTRMARISAITSYVYVFVISNLFACTKMQNFSFSPFWRTWKTTMKFGTQTWPNSSWSKTDDKHNPVQSGPYPKTCLTRWIMIYVPFFPWWLVCVWMFKGENIMYVFGVTFNPKIPNQLNFSWKIQAYSKSSHCKFNISPKILLPTYSFMTLHDIKVALWVYDHYLWRLWNKVMFGHLFLPPKKHSQPFQLIRPYTLNLKYENQKK